MGLDGQGDWAIAADATLKIAVVQSSKWNLRMKTP
jgi:hypothetical protein